MGIRMDKLGLDATFEPDDLDIAWAAGIYEGEGSCVIGGHGGGSFAVAVAQKDPELLYRIRGMFGGSIRYYKIECGRYEIYKWVVCGNRARVFLFLIYPYLTARRQEQIKATHAMKFIDFSGEASLPARGTSQRLAFARDRLRTWIVTHRRRAFESRNEYLRNHYLTKKQDPVWMEARRSKQRARREKEKAEKRTLKALAHIARQKAQSKLLF